LSHALIRVGVQGGQSHVGLMLNEQLDALTATARDRVVQRRVQAFIFCVCIRTPREQKLDARCVPMHRGKREEGNRRPLQPLAFFVGLQAAVEVCTSKSEHAGEGGYRLTARGKCPA
jgi:hypothetical protein